MYFQVLVGGPQGNQAKIASHIEIITVLFIMLICTHLTIISLPMAVVPITFEDIQEYLVEEERIICKPLKLDDSLKKLIKKNGIIINDNQLQRILDAINKQIKRRYRIGLFLKQTRFQAVRQVIELERDKRTEQIDTLNDVNKLLELLGDNIMELDEDKSSLDLINRVEELPDSNLLDTNNVELIEMFDNVREELILNAKKIRKLNKDFKNLNFLEMRLRSQALTTEKVDIDDEIASEIEKMRYLLALNV